MRPLLIAAMVLLSGCALPEADPPETPSAIEPGLPATPPVPDLPTTTVETYPADATLLVDEVDGYHGDYRLIAGPKGLVCEVEAGPDEGVLGYLNVCTLTYNGYMFARVNSTDRSFSTVLMDEIPDGRFDWRVDVYVEVQDGNTTGWRLHDSLRRSQDVSPEAYESFVSQWQHEVCADQDDPVRLTVDVGGHNGRPVFELELQGNQVRDVTGANWTVADDVLVVTGGWSHDPAMSLEVLLDMTPEDVAVQPFGPCGPLTGGQHYELPYEAGVQGIGARWEGSEGYVSVTAWTSQPL